MGTKSQDQMLDFLDQAYHAADDLDELRSLLDSANLYLFETPQTKNISKHLPDYADIDPHLELHIGRLETLILNDTHDRTPKLSIEPQAQFIVSEQGRILKANPQAQKLLGGHALASVENLPMSRKSITNIRNIVKEVRAGVQNIERVIYLQIETETVQPVFAYCRAVSIDDKAMGLDISLSYFEWTPSLFAHLQNALELSESEGLVLQGVLHGKKYKEIAHSRGVSVDTIKAQAKAVLRKSGCENMNDLAHLCTSIAYVIGLSAHKDADQFEGTEWITPRQKLHEISVPDDRTLAYYEYGDPDGKPVVFVHGFLQGPYFLDSMKQSFLENGLRIIAPSRPGFGYTSPAQKKQDYNTIVCADMLALITHLNLTDELLVMAHHGGTSHAFRFAKRIESQVKGILMVGGGIPITAEHIRYMKRDARMSAAAARHAPSVMKMLAAIAIKTYRKKGVDAFIAAHYETSLMDAPSMRNVDVMQKIREGLYHLSQQGPEAFVNDARTQMSNWTEDFKTLHCQQSWVQARHCPLMGAHFIENYVTENTNYPVETIEDAGYNILYQSSDEIIKQIIQMNDLI